MKYYYTLILIFSFAYLSFADNSNQPKSIQAYRTSENITIDGNLNEAIWSKIKGISHFRQSDPDEGEPSTQKTLVYVAYDDENLYIAAYMYDSAPDSIIARMGRRDESSDTDLFGFYVDPYHDKRSGYYFGLSAGGTYYDGILYNDDWDDSSWDGVWYGKSHINGDGWSVEIRVPFSQLRFKQQKDMVWGINFTRQIKRNNEESYLVYRPKKESGFVSRFANLVGLDNIKPSNNIQILPYIRGKSEHIHSDKNDPFNDGSVQSFDMGADFKVGLSSNVTLDATLNPDFGQVEVDPAVINLSDYETFYSEKRPFFIEGASIFNFGYGGATSHWGFNWGNPNFFYSRRIGQKPTGPLPDDTEYSDVPEGTNILGAGKISGKIGKDWNIGAVSAVTNREFAETENENGQRKNIEVEPLSFYNILRAQKEFDEGRHGLGFISTGTFRNFEDDNLRDYVNSEAYTLGLDGWTFLDNEKIWAISGWGGFTSVHGNKTRISDLQQSSRHRYQRPDFKYVTLDSNKTSLQGYGGRILINKEKGNWRFNSAIGVISPGFDVNDMGYMWLTNAINGHIGTGYRWTEPGKYFRYKYITSAVFATQDFDGNTTWSGVWFDAGVQTHDYYWFEIGGAFNPQTTNINLTRGGPRTINKPGYEFFFWTQTDSRKDVVFELSGYTYHRESGSREYNLDLEMNWHPADNLLISFGPHVYWNYPDAQWVDVFDDPAANTTYGKRYVFAQMYQKEISSSIRANWTFSPELSLQVYVQPLLASGDYDNYKYLLKSNSYTFRDFGTTLQYNDGTYSADPDAAGPAAEYSWDNPDFTITSLRGNAVLKWEYLPGSALYLVWTQSRFNHENNAHPSIDKPIVKRFLDYRPDNIFLMKLTYWMGF